MAFTRKTVEIVIAKLQKEKSLAEEKVKPLLDTIKSCDKKITEYEKVLQQLDKIEADFTASMVE